MSSIRSSSYGLDRRIEEDYDKLRRYFISNNVAIGRLKWHPLVILAEKYKGRNIFHFIDECKKYPEFDFNLSIETMSLRDYRNDLRYSLGLLPEIPDSYPSDTPLLLYFKRSYNGNSLNRQLKNFEEQRQCSSREIEDRLDLLSSTLRHFWPYTYMKVIPHGSFITGLAFRKSPFNICIETDEPDLALFMENSLADIHSSRYPVNVDSVLQSFKGNQAMKDGVTDLIRLQLEELPFEIDFNKEITTEVTYLILEYMKLDPRVKPLLNIIKHWGRDKSLFSPQYHRGIRFYSYTVMVLAYLTQLDPPVIPNLQHINHYSEQDECGNINCRSKFKYWDVVYDNGRQVGIAARYHDCVQYQADLKRTTYYVQQNFETNKLYWRSSNSYGVGELFLDFLHYYGYRFNFKNDAVSLKYGGKTPKKSSWLSFPVAIEDPFMSRNLGEPATDYGKFIGDIRGSFTILQSGIPFQIMSKRIGEIMRYDSIRGKDNDRPAYVPFGGWSTPATSKTFLLIDLLKETESSSYTDRIRNLFSTHGEITLISNLDSTTKQVFFNADTGAAKDIVLPTSFTLGGKTVHLVELYEYSDLRGNTQLIQQQQQQQQQQNSLALPTLIN